MIGPVTPYRGGIAQCTTGLLRALRKQTDCLGISFSRQYPQWLFPGKSDKDETLTGYKEPGVEYLIDSLNPLTWRHTLQRVEAFEPTLVILPWWHVYWAIFFAFLIRMLKRQNIQVVVICHNAVEHEDAWWKHYLRRWALADVDRFLVHSSVDEAFLQAAFPDKPVSVHALPLANDLPAADVILPRRAALELLFFGFVRPYKGLDVLLAAMTLLKEEDVFLAVVGEFWQGYGEAQRYLEEQNLSDKVEIVDRYVSDPEAAGWFERCDVVVLPYHSATGSGVVPLAYFYNKPVIATRVGGLVDVVEEGVTGTLVDAGSAEQLAAAIVKAKTTTNTDHSKALAEMKARLSWDSYVNQLLGTSTP